MCFCANAYARYLHFGNNNIELFENCTTEHKLNVSFGNELWCAYHCLAHSNPSMEWCPRNICVQKVFFDESGFPVFGNPVGFENEIEDPS